MWFSPQLVWQIKGADFTVSPVHHAAFDLVHPSRGISVRFPRFVRTVTDRKPEECSTAADIADMFSLQTRKMNVAIKDWDSCGFCTNTYRSPQSCKNLYSYYVHTGKLPIFGIYISLDFHKSTGNMRKQNISISISKLHLKLRLNIALSLKYRIDIENKVVVGCTQNVVISFS